MEEMVQRSNYSGAKFLITNIKQDKKDLLQPVGVLSRFNISNARRDTAKKVYYDTDDMFFRHNGINIAIYESNKKKTKDIIVRYDSSVSRIKFISNIPDTFTKQILASDSIENHFDYIATAIIELVPKGLSVDVFDTIRLTKPVLNILKKRERYRLVNNEGLKVDFSFELATYMSVRHKQKHVMPMLDLRLDSGNETLDMFNRFVRKLNLQQDKFIAQKRSDLFIGQYYLDI